MSRPGPERLGVGDIARALEQRQLSSLELTTHLGPARRPPAPGAREMVDRALRFLARGGASPRFLYLHLMDPHDPYAPPDDLRRAADPAYAGRLSFERGTLADLLRGEIPFGQDDVDHAHALYGGEVAYVDREIGRLLAPLEERMAAGKILVGVTSDHGEEFMEHGSFGHGHSLYEEVVRVPMILARPGIVPAGAVVASPVFLGPARRRCVRGAELLSGRGGLLPIATKASPRRGAPGTPPRCRRR